MYIQKLIPPLNKNGQKKTIGEMMVELSTPHKKIGKLKTFTSTFLINIEILTLVEVRTHGIGIHEEANLQWLSEHLSYPDNFLHIFLVYES